MSLIETWRNVAYNENEDKAKLQAVWNAYFAKEKEFYQSILKEKDVVTGTVKELAEKYDTDLFYMTAILDGINDSLVESFDIEAMEEDTVITLNYDKETLLKNMVAADASWLYNLEEWSLHYTEEERKAIIREQKDAMTVRKGDKVYPNDPCPCGSGKKYKKCCGKNA